MNILKEFQGIDYSVITAKQFEAIVFEHLKKHGNVERDVWVNDKRDKRTGRVDFVLKNHNGMIVGIEVDRKNPRKKSSTKLKNLTVDKRLLVTRSPFRIKEI